MGSITLNKPSGGQLTLTPEDGTSTETVSIPSVGVGKILQVKSITKRDHQAISGSGDSTFVDISGLSLAITPTSSNSKILIMGSVSCAGATGQRYAVRTVMNGSAIDVGNVSGLKTRGSASSFGNGGNQLDSDLTINYLDSPSTTSEVVYKVQGWIEGTNTMYINRSFTHADSYSVAVASSTLTIMEIAD